MTDSTHPLRIAEHNNVDTTWKDDITYISLIRDEPQRARDRDHVDEREPRRARRPAEVLVAVLVEFCVFLPLC